MRITLMKWIWLPIAAVATSVALAMALIALFGLPMPTALASTLGANGSTGGSPWTGGWHGGPWGNGSGFTLPPELKGLADLPPDQRFSHFVGAQLNLKDKDGRPLAIGVTPGTVTAASATSLTIAANDGTTKTFVLNDQTMVRGQQVASGSQANQTSVASGDAVVVVTVNQSTTATAVIEGGSHGFSWSGPRGPWGPTGNVH